MEQIPQPTPAATLDVIAIWAVIVGLMSVAACSACFDGGLAATLVSAASSGA